TSTGFRRSHHSMVFGLSGIYTERGLTQRLTMLLIEYVFTHSGPKAVGRQRQQSVKTDSRVRSVTS
ncbi:hypothetical protein, partial [Pseudomonas syringae]|uniref:hypothetical protein n=1 Tax=Pseudomonas syringae TaxID=317 RepID=UPI001CA58018